MNSHDTNGFHLIVLAKQLLSFSLKWSSLKTPFMAFSSRSPLAFLTFTLLSYAMVLQMTKELDLQKWFLFTFHLPLLPSCSLPSILMFHLFIFILQFLPLISWLEMIAETPQTLAEVWGTQLRVCFSWLPQACYFCFLSLVSWFHLPGGSRTHFMPSASPSPTLGCPQRDYCFQHYHLPVCPSQVWKPWPPSQHSLKGGEPLVYAVIWCTDIILNCCLPRWGNWGTARLKDFDTVRRQLTVRSWTCS